MRAAIFAVVKEARGKPWDAPSIAILDAALDQLGVSRDAEPAQLQPSRAAYELIKSFESCELEAYPDPGSGGDPFTIGWGATGPGIRKGVKWTQEMADSRLKADVARFAGGVAEAIEGGAVTTQNEFDALVCWAFNVGLGAVRSSTLLKLHRDGNKEAAAEQFLRWDKAGGKTLKGLTRRRKAERELYLGRRP
jgi:lysozyme